MQFLYTLTVAFFLTIAIIPVVSRFAARLGLIDHPVGGRKLHHDPIPRVGGLSIILGSSIPLFFLMSPDSRLVGLLPSCGVILFFGLLDDLIELNYKWKLFGQSLAAIIAMAGGVVLFELPFFGMEVAPGWISYSLTYLFLIGVVNGVNFSDGLDGLAGGTSIMASLLILILALQVEDYTVGLCVLSFIGGLLGFLRFNTYPAKVFLGDAGSQLIGFFIACLAILVTQQEGTAVNKFLPVLILGLPILDILQVIPVRIYKNLPLPGPDNEHFHHQLMKLGFRHYEVVAVIYLLQALLLIAAYIIRYNSDLYLFVFYGLFVLTICGSMLFANRHNWQFRQRQRQKGGVERRNRALRRLAWFYRYLAKIVSATVLFFLFVSLFFIGDFDPAVARFSLLSAIFLAIVSVLARKYYQTTTRIACGFASVLVAYLLSTTNLSSTQALVILGVLGFLLVFLLFAIRMTRKDDFSLDTQDLLLLLAVIFLPFLPFDTITANSVGQIALTVFLLLYAVEFLINTGRGSVIAINVGAIVVLGLIGII